MPGQIGFVGQGMSGRKRLRGKLLSYRAITTAGSGTITAPALYSTNCEVWLTGAGAGDNVTQGGGGGASLYKRMRCSPGQTMAYTVGAAASSGGDGGDTTLTMPTGIVLTAGGGKFAGTGGIATNGDVNRSGGAGGAGGVNGSAGTGGGAGGVFAGGNGGGGGAAGFSELGDLTGGAGGAAIAQGAFPGGGNGGNCGSPSGAGRLVALFTRVTQG